jgi:hypothetical protein
MKRFMVLVFGLAALLVACPQQASVGEKALVLASVSQPDLSTCPVIRMQYIALKGSNFGIAADWVSGSNKVIFFDNVVVPSANVELTQAANPATLLVKVPSAAQSGALVVEVAGVKSDPINVIVTDLTLTNAIGVCTYPSIPVNP